MKKKSIILIFISVVITCVVIFSCEKEDNSKAQAQLEFGFKLKQSQLKAAVSTEPYAIVATVTDNSGNVIIDNVSMQLFNFNGDYVTQAVTLKPGSYKLTTYFVVDASGNVMYATPQTGSPRESWVSQPLPISFVVSKNGVTKLFPEVVSVLGSNPEDFGYTTFRLNILNSFDFLIAVFTYQDSSKSYELSAAHVEVSGNGKLLVAKDIDALTNIFSVPDGIDNYVITVTKTGFNSQVETITKDELKKYFSGSNYGPLKIYLMASGEDHISLTTDQTNLNQIKLELWRNATTPLMINWGDNTPEQAAQQSFNYHNYAATGIYNITIHGDIKSITSLSANNSSLSSADISQATSLTNLAFQENKLKNIDVSNNTLLINLILDRNQLTAIDVSKNKDLSYFMLLHNQLTNVDVSQNLNLTALRVDGNANLNSIDISMLLKLQIFTCSNTNISNIDVSKNSEITVFDFQGNPQISNIDVSQNLKLESLIFAHTNVSSINLKNNVALKLVDFSYNPMHTVDLSSNINLEQINALSVQMTSLDISANTKLKYFDLMGNSFNLSEVNNFFLTLYNNVAQGNLTNGLLYINGIEPTGEALIAKQKLIDSFGWTIKRAFD